MKKLFIASLFFGLCGTSHAAFWGSQGSVDYSKDAHSMFYCASTGTVATQAGVSASSPTVALYNPFGSGINLTLLEVGIDVTASPAAASGFMLAFSSGVVPSTQTTTYGITTPALIGKSTTTAIGVCALQGILPLAPTVFRYIGGTTGAAAISGVVFTDQTSGKVVIPPGVVVSLQTTTAASIRAHLLWREDVQ